MIVATLTTQDVIMTVMEAESKTDACRILHDRYNITYGRAKHLVDNVCMGITLIDTIVNHNIQG